jgi:hypothetical protein
MRILFWNIRGLGKSRERNLVKDHIMLEDLDLVAIQEPLNKVLKTRNLKRCLKTKSFHGSGHQPRGTQVD